MSNAPLPAVVTAGFLRQMGVKIEERVPDCATCTLASLGVGDLHFERDFLELTLDILPATPFRWNEIWYELEDGTQIHAVWPPDEKSET